MGLMMSRRYISTPDQNPGGWQLLATGDLNAVSTSVSIEDRRVLWVVIAVTGKGGADTLGVQFNSDNGANYSKRSSANGAADATVTSATSAAIGSISGTTVQIIDLLITNIAGVHKQMRFSDCGEIVAPTSAPNRTEGAAYWDGTAAISSITMLGVGGQTLFGKYYIFGVGT